MRIHVLALAVLTVCACSEDEPSAPLSPVGGGSHTSGSGRSDGGTVDDDDAGSKPDAGEGPAPLECVRIPDPVQFSSDELPSVTATSLPLDFLVTRQVATWRDDCETLVIELSDGACPHGAGHELEISIATRAITDGRVGFGRNELAAEPLDVEGIRARYTRPERFDRAGVYGTCVGSSGYMNFYEAPDVLRPYDLRALYDLTLTACDGEGKPAQRVYGYFDVRVRRTPETACP